MQTMTRDSWTAERLDDLNDRARTIDDHVGDGFQRMVAQGKELRER